MNGWVKDKGGKKKRRELFEKFLDLLFLGGLEGGLAIRALGGLLGSLGQQKLYYLHVS